MESVWSYHAENPGPHLVLLGGVHGNERTGIQVVETIRALFDQGTLQLARGQVTLVLGNPRAITLNTRGSEPHRDLNRLFNPERLAEPADGSYESTRARELAPILASATVLIDIHATNKPSEPFLACKSTPEHERVYRWFRAGKVLADPGFVIAGGAPGTTDEYAELFGAIGICYESGQAGDTTREQEVTEAVLNALRDQEMLKTPPPPPPKELPERFEATKAILLSSQGFRYAEGIGTHSFQPLSKNTVIGWQGETPVIAAEDSFLLFPKIPEHWTEGKPVGYLARKLP